MVEFDFARERISLASECSLKLFMNPFKMYFHTQNYRFFHIFHLDSCVKSPLLELYNYRRLHKRLAALDLVDRKERVKVSHEDKKGLLPGYLASVAHSTFKELVQSYKEHLLKDPNDISKKILKSFDFWRFYLNRDIFEEPKMRVIEFVWDLLHEFQVKDNAIWISFYELIKSNITIKNFVFSTINVKKFEFILKGLLESSKNEREKKEIMFDYKHATGLEGYGEFLNIVIKYGISVKTSLDDLNRLSTRFFLLSFSRLRQLLIDTFSEQRLILILEMCSGFVFSWPPIKQKHYMATISYLWKTTPQAFLTSAEIETILLSVAEVSDIPESMFNQVSTICEKYDETFGYPISKPRSLKHYARCVIRDTVCKHSVLPVGINSLRQPKVLKKYLNLDLEL